MSFPGEQTFICSKEIKYVFEPATVKRNSLVVVFSGFNPKGSSPAYNYIRTLKNLDVNKLFILDDQGERGCYYLGENRKFDIEASVVSLITKIANENNILHSNIICCGSSKGGYASLYFAIKYGLGKVIAGAPQTYLGSYLKSANEYPTLEYIAGDTSDGSVSFLNNIMYDVVAQVKKAPKIFIHVGKGDHHYKGHVLPFTTKLKDKGFEFFLDVKDYSDHGDVSFYQKFLVDKIIELEPSLNDSLRILKVDVSSRHNIFTVSTNTNKKALYAWYVYKDGNKVETKWYSEKKDLIFEAEEPGEYSFLAFAKDENGFIVSERTQEYSYLI